MHSSRTTTDPLALGLASAFLGGAWTLRELVQRGSACLGRRPDWLRALARRVVREFPRPPLSAHLSLASFIAASPRFAWRYGERPSPHVRLCVPFAPQMGRLRWSVPSLPTVGALIDWLGLTPSDLAWFADARGWERFALAETLAHLRYLERRGTVRAIDGPPARWAEAR